MRKRTLVIAGFLSILVRSVSVTAELAKPLNPFDVHPFDVPKDMEKSLDCYRACWQRMTGFDLSGLHWQQFVVVYASQSSKAYENNYFEHMRVYENDEYDEDEDAPPKFKFYEVGTKLVKESFSSSEGRPGEAISLAIMIKREPGYDAKNGDWEYIQTDPKGNYMIGGKTLGRASQTLCINCHKNVAERDYVFSTFFSKK